jgi:hypothetical protein
MGDRYETYCGLYCGACPAFRATQEGKIVEQAAQWQASPKDVTCQGCKSIVVSVYCRTCDLKSCAQERGVDSCAECDAYPCERLTAFRDDDAPHHSVVVRNLDRLAQTGLKRWLEEQAARWRCPVCGYRTTWYDETCAGCGAAVTSSKDEDREMRAKGDKGGHEV